MPSSFHAIFPPPQTLESTGEWGDLDSLLWSLDDPRWLTIGVYGIRGGETARTIQGATVSKRIRLFFGAARAATNGLGFISATVFPRGETRATSSGHALLVRGISIYGKDSAASEEEATSCRVRPVSGSAYAQATETEGPRRVRLLVAPAYAVSGESGLRLLRIRCACGESSAHTLEVAMPSIKGHNWNDEVQGMRDWERLPDTVQTWETQGRGAAIWNAVDDGAADWAPISEAHKTNWRGIVQWP